MLRRTQGMRVMRWMSLCAVLAACAAGPGSLVAEGPGLVKDKPASGPFVETLQGFMVPYELTVPGSEFKIKMIPIPGGVFTMGSSAGEQAKFKAENVDPSSEGPQFQVEIEPFWIGETEITWDQFDPFVDVYQLLTKQAPAPVPAGRETDAVSFPTPIFPQEAIPIINRLGRKGGFPAASMHQFCAKQYTKWLSRKLGQTYRLPAASEWEYACRAGTTTAFYFGDDPAQLKEHAWFFDNAEYPDADKGHPDYDYGYRKVAQLKPNPWGLYDMYGNVAEWVLDEFDPSWYPQHAGKKVSWEQTVNWPDVRFPRELRGGHWYSDMQACRSAARLGSEKEWTEYDPQLPRSVWFMTEFWMGFRVVRPLKTPSGEQQAKFWEPDIDQIRDILKDTKQRRSLVEDIPAN